MKYSESAYLDAEIFPDDGDEFRNYSRKLVTTRKEHDCSGNGFRVGHKLPPKSKALLETAIHVDDGYVSNYICLECADAYLDTIPS